LRRATAFTAAVLGALALSPTASAQEDPEDDLERLAGAVADLISSALEDTHESVFEFLETVELFDAEAEIDRFVGSPWELNDSTAYKLSLLPYHIRYPVYRQLVRQMTRQDDLRSRRIHTVTPESVKVISLGFESFDESAIDYDIKASNEVRESLKSHFNAREMIDLGFFLLAQQRAFPDTDEGWRSLKRTLADGGPALAIGALVAGAAYDLGALSRARPFLKRDWVVAGWYAGFRRLGFAFHPELRGGLTLALPGLELAAGLAEQINPADTDRVRSVELAMREGWLGRLTRPGGWDIFFESALRKTLELGPLYEGEATTGRTGLFFKRYEIPRLRHVTIRGSVEVESDFVGEVRFGASLGFEHARSGLTTVFQASRAPLLIDDVEYLDTRGGVFLTWTIEPISHAFVQALRGRARLVEDEWDAIRALDRERETHEKRLRFLGTSRLSLEQAQAVIAAIEKTRAEREERATRMAAELADYLESRRLTYSILRWSRSTSDLYGPLDPTVLSDARELVFSRLDAISGQLEKTPGRLEQLRRRVAERREPQVEDLWRRESEQAHAAVMTYWSYRDSARRIVAASGRGDLRRRDPDPVRPGVIRRVLSLRTRSP